MLLRVCAAAMLVGNSTAYGAVSIATWEITLLVTLAVAFCLGVFTPFICSLSAVGQASMMLVTHEPDPYRFAFSFCITATLFLLGPGAFSVDSRLFGRRLIVHSKSK